MSDTSDLEKRVAAIEARNMRVEADKAWETSIVRRASVAVLTYVVIVIFFISAGLPNPWTGASIPTVAFLLSTLSLELLRKLLQK